MSISKNFEIKISDLKIKTIIGIFEKERERPQDLIINLEIKFDGTKPSKSDNIEDTIDYFKIAELIKQKVEKTQFELLEKLADFILQIIMENSLVNEAQIEIQKPQALAKFGALVSLKANSVR